MLAQLIPVDGGEPITLTKDITVVGRKPGLCDFVVDKSSVSKLQALLTKTDGLLFLRDLASTNGTKVNGQRVIRGALLPGDEISFASVRYTVHLGPDEKPHVAQHEMTEMMTLYPSDSKEHFGPLEDSEEDLNPQIDNDSDSDVRLLPD